MHNKHHPINSQSGNVLTAALGVIGIIVVIGVSAYSLFNGPIRAATIVTMKSKAQVEMVLSARLIMQSGSDELASGYGDDDGVIELPGGNTDATLVAAITAAGGTGNAIPASIGAAKKDTWGTPILYCVWDHGTITSGANMLTGEGADFRKKLLLALVSAGPNRQFDTACANQPAYLTEDVDTLPGNNDDIIERYTFEQAEASGLWSYNAGSPNKIEYTQGGKVLIGAFSTPPSAEQFQIDGNVAISGSLAIGGDATFETANITESLTYKNDLTADDINVTTLSINKLVGFGAKTGIITNLDADYLSGQHGAYYLDIANTNLSIKGELADFDIFKDYVTADVTADDVDMTYVDADTAKATVTHGGNRSYILGSGTAPTDDQVLFSRTAAQWEYWLPDVSDAADGILGDIHATDNNLWETAKVIGIQGRSVTATLPTANQVLGWNGAAWAPMSLVYGSAGDATTVGFSTGINFLGSSTTITAALCPTANQTPKYFGANAWRCTWDYGYSFALPINADSAPASKMLFDVTAGADTIMRFVTPGAGTSSNVHVGLRAGEDIDAVNAGGGSVFFGREAGKNIDDGFAHTYVGTGAGFYADDGIRNVAIGNLAGNSIGSNNNVVFIGHTAGNTAYGGNSAIVIGYSAGNAYGTIGGGAGPPIVIGTDAGSAATLNGDNIFIGRYAGRYVGNASTALGTRNVFVGQAAGWYGGPATDSVAIGSEAFSGCTTLSTGGNENVFVGYDVAANYTGTCPFNGGMNVAVGSNIMTTGNTNHSNVVMGDQALETSTGAVRNVVMGQQAGSGGVTYTDSIAFGYLTGRGAGSMTRSIAMGAGTMSGGGTLGSVDNTMVGPDAGHSLRSSSGNVLLGPSAGYSITSGGNNNTLIGDCANCGLSTGDDNVIIGQRVGTPTGGSIFTPCYYVVGVSDALDTGSRNILIGRGFGPPAAGSSDLFYISTSRVQHVLYGPMTTGNWTLKGTMTAPSDRRLKHDIRPITNAWDKIRKLNGILYKWKKWYNADDREYLGLRAQDVKKAMPEAVFQNGRGKMGKYMSVAYDQIVPVLIEDMKARQKRIDALKAKITELKAAE